MQPLVVVFRSQKTESIHYGSVAVCDANMNCMYHVGNPDNKIFSRSSLKPFQALTVAESGLINEFGITVKELAIMCGSHSGEDIHCQTVENILIKAGLTVQALDCGSAEPYSQSHYIKMIRSGKEPSPLYNSCSGKHAGMLALCRYYNLTLEGYINAEHPVQKLIRQKLANLLACSSEDLEYGIDGCGVPNYLLTLRQIAGLYALLGSSGKYQTGQNHALNSILAAMQGNPVMVNGHGEFCTDLIMATEGKIVGKIGGEGVYAMAVPEQGLGIAIKIADGRERAVYPTSIHVLELLGILTSEMKMKLAKWVQPQVKNHRGEVIGEMKAVFDIK